ncbi:MAG: hypothetical protein ACFFCE_04100 [Promethearchaeota archaeon]
MKQVKGTVLITIVKSIKVNHNKRAEYDRILSDRAKEFLKKRILNASWYPFDILRELLDAMCLVEGGNDPKILVEWGRIDGKRWFTTVYQAIILKGDLELAIEKYQRFHRKVYNFGEVIVKFISDTELEFTYVDLPRDWENYYHITAGWAKSFVELCLGKEADYMFINKSWKGEGWTKTRIYWGP